MPLAQNLSFILLGEDKTASKTMDAAAVKAEQTTGRIGSAFSKVGGVIGGEFGSILSDVGSRIDDMGGKSAKLSTGLMVGGGVATVTGVALLKMGSSYKQASDQLDQASKSAGDSVEGMSGKVEEAVGTAQNFGFSAVDTKNALAKMTEASGSTEKALDSMSVVTNLAAARHISLSDAATLVDRVMGGSGGKTLSQYGIHMDGVGTKTEQGQRALEELSKKLDGQASASVNNFGSQVGIMRTKIQDWVDQVSGPVGSVLAGLGPLLTVAGVAVDLYRAKKEAATLAEIASASATSTAVAATEAETGAMVGLDASMDANPIGIVALAIGALAAVAGGVALSGQHDLTQATQNYTQALGDNSASLDENVRKVAAKALLDSGALAAAQKLGIATSTLVDATLGNKDAQKQVTDTLKAQTDSLNATEVANGQLANGYSGLSKTQQDMRGSIATLSGAFTDQSSALAAARKNADLYNSSLNKIAQPRSVAQVAVSNQLSYAAHHAAGGDIMHNEMAVVGENGPEMVALPGGSHVYPTGTGPSSGSGNVQITVMAPQGFFVGTAADVGKAMGTTLINVLRNGQMSKTELRAALGL